MDQTYAATPERNVLCDNDVFYGEQNVLVHEVAHIIDFNLPEDLKKEVWGSRNQSSVIQTLSALPSTRLTIF